MASSEPVRTNAVADNEAAACPPHYWIIAQGWQTCKKCDERKVVSPEFPRKMNMSKPPPPPKTPHAS